MDGNNFQRISNKRPAARDYVLALEALMMLAIARMAILFLPFRWTVKLVRPVHDATASPCGFPDDAVIAIDRAGLRAPFRTKCFERGLAGYWMLRRRGIAARLHYGIGRGEQAALRAHVWLSCDDVILLGGDEMSEFAEVASWPADVSAERT